MRASATPAAESAAAPADTPVRADATFAAAIAPKAPSRKCRRSMANLSSYRRALREAVETFVRGLLGSVTRCFDSSSGGGIAAGEIPAATADASPMPVFAVMWPLLRGRHYALRTVGFPLRPVG